MTPRSHWRRLLLVTAAFTLAVSACASDDGGGEAPATGGPVDPADITGTIRLYSYADGFNPEFMASFATTYPKIKLETAAFSSNEEAVAKIQAGFEVDVLNSCIDEATLEMVQKGMYQPLDTARLKNWDSLWPAMKDLPGVTVDGEAYLVPVYAGTAGLMYNADVVTTPPDSWKDLFDPQWRGRASLQDLAITAIDVGALATGIENPLEMTTEQLGQVKEYLQDNKGQFRTFWSGDADIRALFKSGEVVIASGYPGLANHLRKEDGMNVQFTVAEEGQMLWACGFGITPDIAPENLDAAYAVLDWYTSLPPQIFAATTWSFLPSNQGVIDEVPQEVADQASLDSLFSLDKAVPASPPEDRAAWVAAWTEVKAG